MADDLARVRRWLDAGGTVRTVVRSDRQVTLALCTCDTGAEMERVTSTDPELLALLDRLRTGTEAGPGAATATGLPSPPG